MTRVAWIAFGAVSALAVGLAVALAIAIGSGDDEMSDSGGAAAPVLAVPGGAPSPEFEECMSEHGIEPPEPGAPQVQPPAGLEEAVEACAELLPDGVEPGGGDLRIAPSG